MILLRLGGCSGGAPSGQRAGGPLPPPAGCWGTPKTPRRPPSSGKRQRGGDASCARPGADSHTSSPALEAWDPAEGDGEGPRPGRRERPQSSGTGGGSKPGANGSSAGLASPEPVCALWAACASHSPLPAAAPSPRGSSHLHMIRHFAPFMLLSGPPPPQRAPRPGPLPLPPPSPLRLRAGGSSRYARCVALLGCAGLGGPGCGWRMRSAIGMA